MKKFLLLSMLLILIFTFNGCFMTPTQLDIVDTAIENGNFTTLVTALTEADLVETLRGTGPFTVFAPDDDAFAKVDVTTLTNLIADVPNLTKVLLFHVVSGKLMAADVVAETELTSVEGSPLAIVVAGSTVTVDVATITATDIECSNGVIHVIDTVMIPPTVEL